MTGQRANTIQLFLTAAIAAVLLYRQHLMVLNEDVIWLLVQAGRLLDGGRFGADFIEVNTPPALLLYVPAVLLQRLFGLSMSAAHLTTVTAAVAGLVAATVGILRPTLSQRDAGAALWPLSQAIIFAFALQAYHFGQRDCLVILLLLPFILLQAVRENGQLPAVWLQELTGGLAALAIAIKPHYAPLLLVLFLLRWKRDGFWRSLAAPDMRTLVFVAAVLAALSFALFPEWLTMARFAWRFYLPEGRSLPALLSDLIRERWPIFAALLIAFLLWLRLPRTAPLRPVITYLLIASPCLLLAYVLQRREFAYHFVPFEVAVEVAALLAITAVLMAKKHIFSVLLISSTLLVLSLLGIHAVLQSGMTTTKMAQNPVVSAVARLDRGQGIAIFDMASTPAIFATELQGTKIGARTQNLWLLKGAVAALGSDTSDAARQDLDAVEAAIATDIDRYRPDLVLVNPALRLADGQDVLGRLLTRPDFAAVWGDYRLSEAGVATGDGRALDIYVRLR